MDQFRIGATPVVRDLKHRAPALAPKRYAAVTGVRVPRYVRERLAGDLHHIGRRGAGQPRCYLDFNLNRGGNPGSLCEVACELAQRAVDVAVGQNAWPQAEDVVAQIADYAINSLDGIPESLRGRRVIERRRQGLEVHPGAEQGLDHALVKLTRDALALLEYREPVVLVPRAAIFESDGRLSGEGCHQPHVSRRERRSAPTPAHSEGAEHLSAHRQRDSYRRPDPKLSAAQEKAARPLDVGDDRRSARADCLGQDGVFDLEQVSRP
jgi:hypothetical protein